MRRHAYPVVLMFLAAASLHAASDGTLSVTPAVVTLRGTKGQSTKQRVILVNNTSRDFAFDLVAQDVVVRDGKRTFVPAGEIAGSIAATAVFSQKSVVAHPGETIAVDVTVTLPAEAQHRGVVAIFKGTTKIMNGTVPMYASIGTLLTFSTGDDVSIDAAPLEVIPQTATKNLSIRQACSNNGTEPFVAQGAAAILDTTGALVGRIALQPHRLFPTEKTTIAGEYAGELPAGKYRVLLTFDLGTQSVTRSAEVVVR
ncbi:MAG: hypothetical protein QOI24_3663 [Acidobacteriota bacterium]|jgi:hypothetical protein|nr:hypothetical protein [Acidobacteriota bacterium]